MNAAILDELYQILQERKAADGEQSYVASLYAKGTPKIAEKILEEAQEFIDEATLIENGESSTQTKKNLRSEAADLLFHMMVMLSHHDVRPAEILSILEDRFGTSGHVEKANRQDGSTD